MPISKEQKEKVIEKLAIEKQRLFSDCDNMISKLKQEMERKALARIEDLKNDEETLAYLELKKEMYK